MSGSSNSGRGRGDGQRGGGGRDNNGGRGRTPGGRFVMPTGQAFFTGGSSSSSSAPAPRNGLLIGPSGDINMNVKSENSNQNTDVPEKINIPELSIEEDLESIKPWPPVNYSENAPVVLPIGPSSIKQRIELGNEPVFADINDKQALEDEERESILLFQLPSSIQSLIKGTAFQTPPKLPNLKPPPPKPVTGRIGKIQITNTGKMYLVIDQEVITSNSLASHAEPNIPLKYEITPGISTSFSQLISCISPTYHESSTTTATPIATNTTTANLTNSTTTTTSNPNDNIPKSIHLMGKVTRKVVVTPLIDQHKNQSLNTQQNQSRFNNKNKSTLQNLTNESNEIEQINDEDMELIEEEEEEEEHFPYVDDEI
eukprot:CAMPEP_0174820112 /NCGR_PEP_ID=MMETSP1107-20130205/3716_1 /TAXON_ID=36770 /ORGANISM="Paraphysomonas vestita, Strain GFlagA" /LENGTH=369 /DNA_ID=CAMNT_0016034803 /DNA_START=100 /DNA_END=1209 /DNA_ORIENTATION=-